MRRSFFVLLLAASLGAGAGAWAQSDPKSDTPAPANSPTQKVPAPADSKPAQSSAPNLAPPRSDSVNINALNDEPGESSSKDTQIDLSPPEDDARAHPESGRAVKDAGDAPDSDDVGEFHPWDPHRAAKDIEVGDFYFKKKNYAGAESRYREALVFKDNDALATFRLAVCLEKMGRGDEAQQEYQSYLKILPHGPLAEEAQKALERLKNPAGNAKPDK